MAGSVAIPARSVGEALAHVDVARGQGVDLVKLMVTGGVMDATEKGAPGALKMPPEMVRAVCDRAHELGYYVAAHVESTEGVQVALENGVDSIEHGAAPTPRIMDLFRQRGAFLTCTLSPALPYAFFDRSVSGATEVQQFNGKVVFEGIRDNARAALGQGIPVALGNDVGCPWITQYDFWRELVYFQRYVGASARQALHAATLGGATLAGVGDDTGSIEAGKRADLIVVRGNPLDNLHVLRQVDMVMGGGILVRHPRVRRKAAIDEQLDRFC